MLLTMEAEKRPKTAPITPDNYRQLKVMSSRTGLKIGAMVNQAISAWLRSRKKSVA